MLELVYAVYALDVLDVLYGVVNVDNQQQFNKYFIVKQCAKCSVW